MTTLNKVFVMLFSVTLFLLAQEKQVPAFRAQISVNSSQEYILAQQILMDFDFSGFGIYAPADYPLTTKVPLQNGEIIPFDKIKEMTLWSERVIQKKYVSPENRAQYNVDNQGYRYKSEFVINVTLVDWEGDTLVSRIKQPEYSDVYIRGQTKRGDVEIILDHESDDVVHVVFLPNYVLQCSGDKSHIFPNADYKYCPKCGKLLIKITRYDVLKTKQPEKQKEEEQ